MSLFYVSLGGASEPYEVYGGETAFNNFMLKRNSAGARRYRAMDAGGDDRKRLLTDATTWIDDILAQVTPTGEGGTTLRAPVEGAKNLDGSDMSAADQLKLASRATFEAAAILAGDGEASTAADTGSNVKKLDADGASIEFWRPTSAADGTATTYPPILMRILGPLLGTVSAGAAAGMFGLSGGICADSDFEDCDAFRITGPV